MTYASVERTQAPAQSPPMFASGGAGRPLRVLHVVEASFAGVGRHVVDLCQELCSRGHDVHLAYSPIRADSRFLDEISSIAGLHSIAISMPHSIRPGDVVAAREVRRYIQAKGPFDVVHGHSSKGGAVARLAAAKLPTRTVFTPNAFRTADPTLPKVARKMYGSLEALLGKFFTDRVIAVSEEELQHAVDLGLPRTKLALIPNATRVGPTKTREQVRQELRVPADAICVLFVGRLNVQKAPERFIDAVATLHAEGVGLHAVIGGYGPLLPDMQRQIAINNLSACTTIVEDQRGIDLMAAADLLVLTSRYEGFPYVLLEALQVGLPIVATDVGGVRAVINDGINGYIVSQDDQSALVSATRTVVLDREQRRRMAAQARRKAEVHTLENMVDAVELLYRNLAGDVPKLAYASSPAFDPVAHARTSPS